MGIGDFISDITPDSVEHAVEKGTEWVGDRVEDAGNWTADRLEDVGWDSGADWVREQSRSVANRMGAEVDEMDLGQTDDKTKLVYGSPGTLRSTAEHLRNFHKAFDTVGDGLKGLDSSHLKGEAAEAFRKSVQVQPPKWFTGADACENAAKALDAFADTVTWAQGRAQTAIDKWKEGTKASEDAAEEHKKKVDAYNKAADHYNAQPADKRDPKSLPPKPGAFTDPGKPLMHEAQEILAEARKQRNTAAETASAAIRAARDKAPAKPSYTDQVTDGLGELQVMSDHFTGGLIKGTAGLLNFARGINPLDPYNITHPAEYVTNLDSLAAGLVTVANDPWGAGKQMVTDFMKDPAEGLGRLVPDIALTLATDGAGAGVKAARTADEAADAAAAARRAEHAEDASRTPERKCKGREPVDFATGRMFLPQQDVTLPGSLPLVFRRDFESSYRAGGWFGPTWSSTIDQRLTVDAIGVVYHGEDNLLLSYPHPAPGSPVLPQAGPRWPLERHTDGGYSLTDPHTGTVHGFHSPAHVEPGGNGIALLAEIQDRAGRTITAEYDERGVPLALTHSSGYRLEFTTHRGRITALRLAGAGPDELIRYGYHEGHLTEVTRSSGRPTRFEYDADGRITAWTDTNGSRYTFVYDQQDRCISQTGVEGHMRSEFHYGERHPESGLSTTTVTDSLGHTWRYTVNDRLQVIAETDPNGATIRTTHDRYGRPLSKTDALGRTTTLTYDEHGRPTTIAHPDGRVTRAEYPSVLQDHDGTPAFPAGVAPLALPTRVTGPDGLAWHQTYDSHGNRTTLTDPTGSTTTFTYNGAGHLIAVTDPAGHPTHITCDSAGLPLEVRDPLGAVTRYERDAFGRPVTITDPVGAVTHLEWTVEGLLARRTAADGSTESWTYDGEGNCTAHCDPQGAVTGFSYGHFDVLTARTDPDGVTYAFAYDTELRLTHVTDPEGLVWKYTHDPAGRLTSETDFDGRTITYTYDEADRLVSRTTPLGHQITFHRNPMGQIVRKTVHVSTAETAGAPAVPETYTTTYTYDHANHLAEAVGPDGTTLALTRDRYGRLRSESVDGRAITYTYDSLGRLTHRTTPTGVTSAWTYDAAGRPATLTTAGRALTFHRDAAGQELTRQIGEVVTLTHTYDPLGRLLTQSLQAGPNSRPSAHRSYTYRPDGHVTAIDDAYTGLRHFDLDSTGRVTGVHAHNWTERYAYDGAGNQSSADWPATHPGAEARGPRAYTGTLITRAGGVHYEHDASGRITARRKKRLSRKPDIWRYEWDPEDRLTAVTTPDGTHWRYTYDPLGRRTSKQRLAPDGRTVTEKTVFVWDATILCEQTTTGDAQTHPITLTWTHDGLTPLTQTERITTHPDPESAEAPPPPVSVFSTYLSDQPSSPAADLPTKDAPAEEIACRFFAIVSDLVGAPAELVDDQGTIAWRSRSTLWGTTAWNKSATTYTPLRFPGQYFDPETGLHSNYFRTYDPETARYLTPDPVGLQAAPNPSSYVPNPHVWADPLGLAPEGCTPARTPDGGWDVRGKNPLDIVPPDAEVRQLKPDPNGGAQKGVEYKWTDPQTGNTVRLRIHDKDGTAPPGSNAAKGDVYRVSIGGRYQDETGFLHHRNVHKPNSPHYNPDAANDTHIPWPQQYPLPY